jgi:galactose mutarotase-like enzyme
MAMFLGFRRPLLALMMLLGGSPAFAEQAGREPTPLKCYDAASVGPLVELTGRRGRIVATVAPRRGALLAGLTYRTRAGERIPLLYRDNDFCQIAGWDGKAPLLWPATGRNFNPAAPDGFGWRWNGNDYPLEIHGFARDLPWTVVRGGAGRTERLDLRLTDNKYTRARYPFGFVFNLTYRIIDNRLMLVHRITAAKSNSAAMPFSIGNHVTFRQPLGSSGPMRITAPAQCHIVLDDRGKPTGDVEDIAGFNDYPVDQFEREKAFSLTGFNGAPRVTLSDPTGITLRLSHRASAPIDGTPVIFNLWGNAEKGFFSPEPWYGRQNSLASGEGLVRLAPGRTFVWTLEIAVSD